MPPAVQPDPTDVLGVLRFLCGASDRAEGARRLAALLFDAWAGAERWRGRGDLVGVGVHLHDGQGFVGGAWRSPDDAPPPAHGWRTLWAALQDEPGPVALNVALRQLWRAARAEVVPGELQRSATFLGGPGVTHVLGLPLRGPPPTLLRGMATWSWRAPRARAEAAFEDEDVAGFEALLAAAAWIPLLPAPAGALDPTAGVLATPCPEAGEALLLVGGPGTGKAWLARQLAVRWGTPQPRVVDARHPSAAALRDALGEPAVVVLLHADELPAPLQAELAGGWSGPLVATAGRRLDDGPAPLRRLARWTVGVPPLAERAWRPLVEALEACPPGSVPDATLAVLATGAWPQGLRDVDAVLRHAHQRGALDPDGVRRSIEQLLRREGTLLARLRPAARALYECDREIPLDLLQGLGGLVVAEGLATGASGVQVARRFGRVDRNGKGNEHKALRPWLDRLDALKRALGEP